MGESVRNAAVSGQWVAERPPVGHGHVRIGGSDATGWASGRVWRNVSALGRRGGLKGLKKKKRENYRKQNKNGSEKIKFVSKGLTKGIHTCTQASTGERFKNKTKQKC